MSTIQITELLPVGTELFQDRESFLHELTDQDMGVVQGGGSYVITSVIPPSAVNTQVSYTYGISLESISIVTAIKAPY